jgi:hypothetical protein
LECLFRPVEGEVGPGEDDPFLCAGEAVTACGGFDAVDRRGGVTAGEKGLGVGDRAPSSEHVREFSGRQAFHFQSLRGGVQGVRIRAGRGDADCRDAQPEAAGPIQGVAARAQATVDLERGLVELIPGQVGQSECEVSGEGLHLGSPSAAVQGLLRSGGSSVRVP